MPLIDDSMDESTPWLIEKLQQRYLSTDVGFIIDNDAGKSNVWCITLPAFERWFSELEEITNQTLGRRLAYASAESEEWRWSLAPPLTSAWIGKQKKRVAEINSDWAIRGLGQLAMLESSNDEATLLVANRGHTAIAAGMGNAVWEHVQDFRFRFQWSDRGAGETMVQTTRDPRQIPAAKPAEISWTNLEGNVSNQERLFNRARHETEGVWTVEGNRTLMLQGDLLLRFENLTIPYLADTPRSTDARSEWDGVSDTEKIVLWDSMAEASRRQFLASGELVLVAEPDHWISVSNQHLAMQGLGCVTTAVGIDEHGGVDLLISAALHPAIVVGRLIGCWERAEGRAAKATWSSNHEGHHVRLESRREIAE
ncbi:MAG TPA: hypothetical protein QF514_03840 [Candidatus Thalassarchaeaceae archaeon]|nr:hypothetical protein [Candidatus Thalassarchaeaceae archaeon]